MSTTREPHPKVSVSESRYSASAHGPVVDAGVQSVEGNSAPAGLDDDGLGHHGATALLPDLRNSLRSVDEVERDRGPARASGWTWPVLVGIGTFALMIGASPIVVWFALSGGSDPAAKPPPPQQEELMGIPVRRGLK